MVCKHKESDRVEKRHRTKVEDLPKAEEEEAKTAAGGIDVLEPGREHDIFRRFTDGPVGRAGRGQNTK